MRSNVRALWARGWTNARIGAELGVSEEAIAYHRRKLVREDQHAMADSAARRAEQVAIQRHIRTEALDAWDRSKVAMKTTTKEQAKDEPLAIGPDGHPKGGGSKTRVRLTEEETAGDTQYLRVALDAMRAERELLGLDAPKKIELTAVKVGERTVNLEDPEQVATLTRDELEQVAAKMGLA